jgi:GNAT superfamily N-acetyltransferase
MKIKLFQGTDSINELKSLSRKAFGATTDSDISKWFSFDEMKTTLDSHRGVCVTALSDDGRLAGFVFAQQENPINGSEGLEKWVIVITAVDPGFAGQGVGSLLLKEVEKEATAKGATKMFVYTNKGDEKVVEFYKKNGYADAGWVKDYQYGKDNSAVFLLKHLG